MNSTILLLESVAGVSAQHLAVVFQKMPTGVNQVKRRFFTKRRLFLAFLAVCFTMGVYSLVIGVWLYVGRTDFHELAPSSLSAFSAAGLCCSMGVTVCIISVLGWMGVVSYNRRLLITYICFVLVLAAIQTATVFFGFYYKKATRERVRDDLFNGINHTDLTTGQGAAFSLAVSWDRLQKSLECCGVDDGSDWYYSIRWPSQRFVPDSCCDPTYFSALDSTNNCGKMNNNTLVYQQGCGNLLSDWIYHHVSIMSWISLVLLIIELISLSLAVPLARSGSFITGSSGRNPEEYRRCLVELKEIEGYLRAQNVHMLAENYYHARTINMIDDNDHDNSLDSVL